MPTIVFANVKGGCGKTTSATLLASELAEFATVTLIDGDPNLCITTWASQAKLPKNMEVITNKNERTIIKEIDAAAERNSFVIVDLEGIGSRKVSYAISRADLVIVPIQEQKPDADMAATIIEEIEVESQRDNRVIPFVVLFTKTKVVKSRTNLRIRKEILANPDLVVLGTELIDRDAYAAMWTDARVIRELDPNRVRNIPKAVENALAFTEEVVEHLQRLQEEQEAA